jgi:hypothetical protein
MFASLSIILFSLWSLSYTPLVKAYPFGAGGCDGGVPAVGAPHLPGGGVSTIFKNGTLTQGNITVLLDGIPLTPKASSSFTVGKNHTLTLHRVTGFKGLLFRLGNVALGTLSPQDATLLSGTTSDPTLVSFASACVGVDGVTHTSAEVKSQANAQLRIDTAASDGCENKGSVEV